jgi:hypothetical protein
MRGPCRVIYFLPLITSSSLVGDASESGRRGGTSSGGRERDATEDRGMVSSENSVVALT